MATADNGEGMKWVGKKCEALKIKKKRHRFVSKSFLLTLSDEKWPFLLFKLEGVSRRCHLGNGFSSSFEQAQIWDRFEKL